MNEFKFENMKIVDEYDSTVDKGRRITIRKRKNAKTFEHYRTTALEDGTLILRPRVLADPDQVIGKFTLKMIDESMLNAAEGKLGDTFNPDEFNELISEED